MIASLTYAGDDSGDNLNPYYPYNFRNTYHVDLLIFLNFFIPMHTFEFHEDKQ